jgi:hypothetical protein
MGGVWSTQVEMHIVFSLAWWGLFKSRHFVYSQACEGFGQNKFIYFVSSLVWEGLA